jgi:hypothetical protein
MHIQVVLLLRRAGFAIDNLAVDLSYRLRRNSFNEYRRRLGLQHIKPSLLF